MKYQVFLLVFILGLISSIALSTNDPFVCKPGEGCDVVTNSNYGSTFGVQNSLYGVFIFIFTIAVTLFHIRFPSPHTKKILHAAIIVGSLIAAYFLFLQIFVIHAYCKFCLMVDIALLVALGFMIYLWEH